MLKPSQGPRVLDDPPPPRRCDHGVRGLQVALVVARSPSHRDHATAEKPEGVDVVVVENAVIDYLQRSSQFGWESRGVHPKEAVQDSIIIVVSGSSRAQFLVADTGNCKRPNTIAEAPLSTPSARFDEPTFRIRLVLSYESDEHRVAERRQWW